MRHRRPWHETFCRAIVGVAAIAAAVGAGAAWAASDEALGKVMQQLAARRHGHASFVERKTVAVLKRPVESSGELLYDAPGLLEKRTLLPKPETLRLDNGALSIVRGTRTMTMTLSDYPDIAPFIDTIRATLAGDQQALERSYTLEFHAQGTGWDLVLVPRDPKLARSLARVRIAGSADRLQEVTIEGAKGDRSVMTIHELADP